MTIRVNEDWWKHLFDEVYLQTDSRSIGNKRLTNQEVDFIEQELQLQKSAPLLDLCGGQGRHALELARRGFSNITVLDYSDCLVNMGKKKARAEKLSMAFIRGDGRALGFRSQSFQTIILMGSSFGYFVDDGENRKILDETFRLLMPKGTLLLDLPDRSYVLEKLQPFSCHRATDDIYVTRIREVVEDVVYSHETVKSEEKGRMRDQTYCIRLYSETSIASLLKKAGFSSIAFQRDFMCRKGKGDYGGMTNRMIVKAKK